MKKAKEVLLESKFKNLTDIEKQQIENGLITYSFAEILTAMEEYANQQANAVVIASEPERLIKKDAKILFAEIYQICGALGCNAKILDNLSAASRGLKPPHKTLLPFVDRESVPAETLVMPKIADGLNDIINDWNKEEDRVDEQIKFLREHRFEIEAIATYNKRNEMTNRRLRLQHFIDSNFTL